MTATRANRTSKKAKHRAWLIHPAIWMAIMLSFAADAATAIRTHVAEAKNDERGNVITDNLAWIVFGVIAVVAIGALIKALGATIINWVGKQLGIG